MSNKKLNMFQGKSVEVTIDHNPDLSDQVANRADMILDARSTMKRMTLERLQSEHLHRVMMAVSPRYSEYQRIANPPLSRNKREGRYSVVYNKPNEPYQVFFGCERKRGRKSRNIEMQEVNNDYRRRLLNDPSIQWWKKPHPVITDVRVFRINGFRDQTSNTQ